MPLSISQPSLSSPTYTDGSALPDGTYFWKVRAKDGAGNVGAFSSVFTFTIDSTGPTVTASPVGGTFGVGGTSVELSSADADLDAIYYTTDGSEPTSASNLYSIAIPITATTTLKAIGYDTFDNPGPVITEVYVIDSTGPTVTATPVGGTFGVAGTSVELSSADADIGTIYYTTDGSEPDNTDTAYTTAIDITADTTLKAIGYDTYGNAGPVMTEDYTITTTTTIDTSMSLKLEGNNKIPAGSTYTASGKLIDAIADSPIAGKTISVTTDGSSPVSGITDSKGKFTVTLTAPNTIGKHDIQAHFAGDSQYNPSDSPVKKLTVIENSLAITTATTNIDTSLSLKLEGKDKMAGGSTYSVSGKLIDSVSKKPISGKEISVTTDGGSPKGTDTTNGKGEYEVNLKAPDSSGKYDIKAHFAGDSQYKSSDSSVTKITVEGPTLTTQKTTVTTDQPQPEEEQPEEEQPEEEPTS